MLIYSPMCVPCFTHSQGNANIPYHIDFAHVSPHCNIVLVFMSLHIGV